MRLALGASSFAIPDGWSETDREPDRVILRSADENEQATISTTSFAAKPTFAEFELLCKHRLDAERATLGDGFVDVTAAKNTGKQFVMVYSGADKSTERLFSGYLGLTDTTLITIYLEAIGTRPEQHLATFRAFVTGKQ
jgi:hypothetical protein